MKEIKTKAISYKKINPKHARTHTQKIKNKKIKKKTGRLVQELKGDTVEFRVDAAPIVQRGI